MILTGIGELPATIDLKVFPGDLLPQPDETGVADHAQHRLDFRALNFLLQKSIDAVRDIGLVIDRRQGIGVERIANEIAGQLKHASYLPQGFFLAGLRPEELPDKAPAAQIKAEQQDQNEQDENRE